MMTPFKTYWIDLFCGAGGTTTGIHMSEAEVIACVNHDATALESHKINNPNAEHFEEDIRDWSVVYKLSKIVAEIRKKDPLAIICIWASLECTHFSKAKGGMSRDADSRTLAYHLLKYVRSIRPEYLYIENVREFLTWGPLDEKGKPIENKKGDDYCIWKYLLEQEGFHYEYSLLDSADYGAYTSRKRYFGIFAKEGYPIHWPEPTHSKSGEGKPKWKPVKDVLDFSLQGRSILGLSGQNKPYSDNTLERVFMGMEKFCTEEAFLTSYYGNGGAHSIDSPCNTLTTKDRFAVHFIHYDYSTPQPSGVDRPVGSITTVPKQKVITAKWLVDTQYSNKGRSVEEPCQTLIARMDKKPVYLIEPYYGGVPKIKRKDSPIVKKIKLFMIKHGIAEVTIRMLSLEELLRIQGFPTEYVLLGNKDEQLKFIGNSVVPKMAKALVDSNRLGIEQMRMAA